MTGATNHNLWLAPMIVVLKKDNSPRCVIDFSMLNILCKKSAEAMLDLIGQLPLNGKSGTNNKKNINHRIYEEYVETLNELFDKWTSLKLIEQLKDGTKSE